MRTLKHLPVNEWPHADRTALKAAYTQGDIFDETNGPGFDHSDGTRHITEVAYRRWMGFLQAHHATDLLLPPVERITPESAREYIELIGLELRPTSVVINVGGLYTAARLIAPYDDWSWLKALHARLAARAVPLDRFHKLVPPWQTLDLGLDLMDEALSLPPDPHHRREFLYRGGLILSLLSLWPIRRRSIAALTHTHHVRLDQDGITLLLKEKDTKSTREMSFRLPDVLVPYFKRYLQVIREKIPGAETHDGLWASNKAGALSGGRIYDIVRHHTGKRYGKAMGLHDFRRAAATFICTDAPEKVGLIPGVLQHKNQETSEKHYVLARSIKASRRNVTTIEKLRAELRIRAKQFEE